MICSMSTTASDPLADRSPTSFEEFRDAWEADETRSGLAGAMQRWISRLLNALVALLAEVRVERVEGAAESAPCDASVPCAVIAPGDESALCPASIASAVCDEAPAISDVCAADAGFAVGRDDARLVHEGKSPRAGAVSLPACRAPDAAIPATPILDFPSETGRPSKTGCVVLDKHWIPAPDQVWGTSFHIAGMTGWRRPVREPEESPPWIIHIAGAIRRSPPTFPLREPLPPPQGGRKSTRIDDGDFFRNWKHGPRCFCVHFVALS